MDLEQVEQICMAALERVFHAGADLRVDVYQDDSFLNGNLYVKLYFIHKLPDRSDLQHGTSFQIPQKEIDAVFFSEEKLVEMHALSYALQLYDWVNDVERE